MPKIALFHFATAKEAWAEEAQALYQKKISHFAKIDIQALKIKKVAREEAQFKKNEESRFLIESLSTDDYVILFDEKGKSLNSLEFSKKIENALASSKKRVVFVIGGAYGVNDEVKKRAEVTVSLSALTFNHLLAQTIALEQIYRAFTILNRIPYHNEG